MLRVIVLTLTALASGGALADQRPDLPGMVLDGFAEGVNSAALGNRAQWETIQPRPVAECLAETGGVINEQVMRCRNGRQEQIRRNLSGERQVIQERPIPK